MNNNFSLQVIANTLLIMLTWQLIEARNVRLTNGIIFRLIKRMSTYHYSIPILYREAIEITPGKICELSNLIYEIKNEKGCELNAKIKCDKKQFENCKNSGLFYRSPQN